MTALTIQLELPEQLAEEARNAGLLSSEAIEKLLREQLRKRGVDELFDMADRLAAVDLPPMSEDEVQAEVDAVRDERRLVNAAARSRATPAPRATRGAS